MKSLKKTVRRNNRILDEVDCIMEKIVRYPEIGKELTSDLFGMRAVASADGKYRIVYKFENTRREVVIHAVGGRKRIYGDLARILKRIMPYTRNRSFGTQQGKNDDRN